MFWIEEVYENYGVLFGGVRDDVDFEVFVDECYGKLCVFCVV